MVRFGSLEFKGTRKSGAIQQNPGEMASWCLDRGGRAGNGKLEWRVAQL